MKYEINQPSYEVPYVRLKEDIYVYSLFPDPYLKIETEYPLYTDEHKPGLLRIQVSDGMFNNIISVEDKQIEIFIKTIVPKFQLGMIVTRKDAKQYIPFKVAQYTILAGRVWYRNEWSIKTGFENGVYEEHLIEIK